MTIQQKQNEPFIGLNACLTSMCLNLDRFILQVSISGMTESPDYPELDDAWNRLLGYLDDEADETKNSNHERIGLGFKRLISCLKGFKNDPCAQDQESQDTLNHSIDSLCNTFENTKNSIEDILKEDRRAETAEENEELADA